MARSPCRVRVWWVGFPRNKPRVKTPVTPDEPDALDANPYPARPWGGWLGDGFVECVGLIGGFWGRVAIEALLWVRCAEMLAFFYLFICLSVANISQ